MGLMSFSESKGETLPGQRGNVVGKETKINRTHSMRRSWARYFAIMASLGYPNNLEQSCYPYFINKDMNLTEVKLLVLRGANNNRANK